MDTVQESKINPYQLYFNDLSAIVEKIVDERPKINDFEELRRLLKLGGLSDVTIEGIYRRCGFDSWQHFLDTKYGVCGVDQDISVGCVEEKIRGALSSLRIVFSKKLYD
jgi:hypothetical protein